MEWTDDLRRDLLACHVSSDPSQRGYMARMYSLWCEMHPELAHFSPQNLRDHVNHLRRKGFGSEPPNPVTATPQSPQAADAPSSPAVTVDVDNDFKTRFLSIINTDLELKDRQRSVHHKLSLRPAHLAEMDGILDEYLSEDSDLWTIDCAIYAAANVLATPALSRQAGNKSGQRIKQLDAKIKSARQLVSRIQCVIEYILSGRKFTAKVRRISRTLRTQYHTLNKATLQNIKQHGLDKIRALTSARKKLVRRNRAIKENATFKLCPSRVFKASSPVVCTPPTATEVEQFWKDLYETKPPLNEDTPAIHLFRQFCNRHLEDDEVPLSVSEEDVKNAFLGKKSFSAPGIDALNNFWWKKFPSTHKHLSRIFTSLITGLEHIPTWLTEGRTVLIPKKGNLSDPKNYRPITCLNTVYKAFTSILNERILRHIEPVWREIYEQRGSKRGVSGCRDNLLIDRCICQDAVQYKRNLSMAWVDYRKAFDTTSHDLLIMLLNCLKVHPDIVKCIEHLLPLWRTRFIITAGKSVVTTELVSYHRGVFQGDSLSPLLFCISLLPISISLRRGRGYMCGTPSNRRHKVTHLFYMDDLKLYAASAADLTLALNIVQVYSQDIGMAFGLDKCAVLHIKKGRNEDFGEDMQLVDGSIIHHLNAGDSYTYLGVSESHVQDVKAVKETLRSKYRQTLRQIWSSELSGKNKVAATNMLAVPVLLYTFGAFKWTVNELQQLDRGTRKMMTIYRSLHPKSSVPRLYLPRHLGGRGLLSLECLHNRIALGTAIAVCNSTDPLMRLVCDHESAGVGAFLFQAASRAANDLSLDFDFSSSGRPRVTSLMSMTSDQAKHAVKKAEQKFLLKQHTDKPMHGNFYKNIDKCGLSKDLTFAFLRSAGLKSETEGFVLACQDGVINTLVYRRIIMDVDVIDTSCRACRSQPETLMHLLSACSYYASCAYIHRHNAALRVLYYHLRHHYGIDKTPVLPYAPGEIESVIENETCKIFWNFSFSTTRQLTATKPDIVLLDKTTRSMYVIEFSAPAETNVVAKETEKRTKYQDLLFELRKQYPEYSVKLIVLIIGVLGGAKPSLLASIKAIPACQRNAESLACRMQKAVLIGSLRVLRAHDPNSL